MNDLWPPRPLPQTGGGDPIGTAVVGAANAGAGKTGGNAADPNRRLANLPTGGTGTGLSAATAEAGNLPFPTLGTGAVPVTDLATSFAQGTASAIAATQQALYMAGYYGSTPPLLGVVRDRDYRLFETAARDASHAGKTVAEFLLGAAQVGQRASVAVAAAKTQGTITIPTGADVTTALAAAFQNELGRDPSPKEARAFASAYRTVLAGAVARQSQLGQTVRGEVGLLPAGPSAPPGALLADVGAPNDLGQPGGMRRAPGTPDFTPPGFVAQTTGPGGLVDQGVAAKTALATQPPQVPDLSAAAEQYVSSHYGDEVSANKALYWYNVVMNAVQGGQ